MLRALIENEGFNFQRVSDDKTSIFFHQGILMGGFKGLTNRPIFENKLGDLSGRLIRPKQKVFGLSGHENQPQVDLVFWHSRSWHLETVTLGLRVSLFITSQSLSVRFQVFFLSAVSTKSSQKRYPAMNLWQGLNESRIVVVDVVFIVSSCSCELK